MDSLTHETMVSRSAFLALLDGLKANKGILIIGSSNSPDQIDPALVHRPSRFDRVWTFPVPELSLRRMYLAHHFSDMTTDIIDSVAAQTGNWSYAYLNELRTTAAILAVGQGLAGVTPDVLLQATTTLAGQFTAGRKNHAANAAVSDMGFKVA
jgi:ATP-dependent 26S proteasome regulatory subunit